MGTCHYSPQSPKTQSLSNYNVPLGRRAEATSRSDSQRLLESWVGQTSESDQAPIQHPSLSADELLLYHQVWRALLRGANFFSAPLSFDTRAPLPVELVRLVVRAAEFMVPDRHHTQRTHRSLFVRVVIPDEEPIVSRVWFWTKPLDVTQIAAAQLVTLSRDQGWVNPPTETCHSWFEWGVFNAGVPVQDETDIRETWRRTHGNRIAQRRYEQYGGPRAGVDDELWEGVKAGAVIAVRVCAQQHLWENDALWGEILVWK
ncbi:hypothetical protein C8J57DRAFT_1077834 [Mycena rebaudengoi]|nr:hypothetical protein C8J57DRAFT_1077834 [Mycena rebaudengoi]